MEGMNVETFFGPSFVILCISFILYGLLCAQIYYYYTTYQDHLALKLVVLLLFILETVHVAASIHMLYGYLIINFANPAGIINISWSFKLLVYLEQTVDPLVQSYYIYRVWCVSQNKILSLALVSVLLARIAVALRGAAYVCIFDTWLPLGNEKLLNIYLNATLALSASVDFLVTFALTYYFTVKCRSSAHARSTKKILLKLTYYSITAGALTAVANLVSLIWFNTSPTSQTYFAILQMALHLTGNAMLAVLNARRSIARSAASPNGISLELSQLSHGSSQPERAIHILQETLQVRDDKWNVAKHVNSSQSSQLVSSHAGTLAV
ncbi:hypothetical protein BDY19DRAFT_155163 [Irpex rosettiformis]|uniref:Uncharacterized protein n=1 Tax=Irpex rosettiformis TaxID=378272 RepID=A0ACB8U3K8_9APHY|nr:hypothetical protein BDY19DRAFT_155163 [Irpex rosettiformis]